MENVNIIRQYVSARNNLMAASMGDSSIETINREERNRDAAKAALIAAGIDPEKATRYDAEIGYWVAAHDVARDAGMNVRCVCGAEYSQIANLRRHIARETAV